MGYYLALNNDSSIECIVAAIDQSPQGMVLLVAGDFDTEISEPKGHACDKEISTVVQRRASTTQKATSLRATSHVR